MFKGIIEVCDNANEDTEILTSKIQAQVDRDRKTPILQKTIYLGSQPSVMSRTFRRSLLIDRRQPSHHNIPVSRTKPSDHRSDEVRPVNLASNIEESNRRWRGMPQCTICMQLGHMAQTCPRSYTAQPPPQVSPLHIVY